MISDTYDVSLSIENAFQNIDRLDLCKYVISIFEYVNQNEYVDLTLFMRHFIGWNVIIICVKFQITPNLCFWAFSLPKWWFVCTLWVQESILNLHLIGLIVLSSWGVSWKFAGPTSFQWRDHLDYPSSEP